MDCKKSTSHIVLPIFYKVAPSDVRDLKGKFGKAFHSHRKHFDKKDIEDGQRALREVSYLAGWESEKIANGHEGELVEKVIKTLLSKLRHDYQLDVTKHFVGIDDHVNKIRNWVDTPAIDARMIGIYGMGGIGKTTLAKVIYNELSNDFVHRTSLVDIRKIAYHNGIPYLQDQLIREIQPIAHQVSNIDDGINLIKSRLREKKVLILLDDIDHKDQLNALARESTWFGLGSIIIVTTRNKAVLDQSEFKVDYKYELNEIDDVHSLLLFNKHAFRMNHSSRGFEDISRAIISTMGGLPLAIEVIGSYLYGKTHRDIWQDVLEKLRKEPHSDVQKNLKVSYDGLEPGHKEIFLDFACFFIGKESKFAMYMWKDRGFYASQGIEELKLRCLIKIGDNGELMMHDQLRDLGRNIVCQEGPLEKRSRLYVYDEALSVLMEKKGTESIQAICLDEYHDHALWDNGHLETYTNEQFKNLLSLRILQLRGAALSGDFNRLFSKLRWLQWSGIEPDLPFSTTNLHLPKLVVLHLSRNTITEDWRGWSSIMTARRLKVLDLSFCHYLKCTPDFSAFTELEILILKKCRGLKEVHSSIGKVKTLIYLDLSSGDSLKELPGEVGKLQELKELILDSTGITKIPKSIRSLRKLEKLSARGCRSLRKIPSSIVELQNLKHLDIGQSAIEKLPKAIGRLKNLRRLNLKLCRRLKGEIPNNIGDLSSLEILEITGAPISNLPDCIRNLSSLQRLNLEGCYKLWSLPELPLGLRYLTVSNQSPRLPELSCLIHLEELALYHCVRLRYIPQLPSRLLKLRFASCFELILPKLDEFKYLEELSIEFCGSLKRLDLSQLNRLKRLHAKDCYNLVEIQGHDNFESLEEIVIYRCKLLERMIFPELKSFKQLKASQCDKLVEIQGLDRTKFL